MNTRWLMYVLGCFVLGGFPAVQAEETKAEEAAKPAAVETEPAESEEGKAAEGATSAEAEKAAEAEKKAEAGKEEDPWWVKIDDHKIMKSDVVSFVKTSLQQRNPQQPVAEKQIEQIVKQNQVQIVRQMVDDYLMEREADKEKIEVSEEEMMAAMRAQMEQYMAGRGIDEAEMERQVEQGTGMKLDAYLKTLINRPDIVRTQRFLKLTRKSKKKFFDDVTEEGVKAHYERNKQRRYEIPEQRRASHILIKVDPNADEKTKKEAREEIEKILKEVKKGDEEFADLAKSHSQCPSSARGGDLNFFALKRTRHTPNVMVEPFGNAAFAMKVGEVSDVVETQFGYHIIKLTDIKEGKTMPYDDVKASIRTELEGNAATRARNELLKDLKDEAEITYAEGVMAKPKTVPGPVRPDQADGEKEEEAAEKSADQPKEEEKAEAEDKSGDGAKLE